MNAEDINPKAETVLCNVDIADFTAVRFVGFDMDTTVRIPETNGTVLAATQAIVAVAVEPGGQNGTFVAFEYISFVSRQIRHAHLSTSTILRRRHHRP